MQQRNPKTMRDMTILGGWLFADLLLALFVIFMAAQPTIPLKIFPTPTPTPTPTPIAGVTVTPTPVPRLELKPHRFQLTVDYVGLLSDTPSAIAGVQQQVRGQSILHGRSVGLVIAYGGAPDDASIPQALSIASKVYNVLAGMGQQGFAFQRASYYDPIYYFGNDPSVVIVDVYLFQ